MTTISAPPMRVQMEIVLMMPLLVPTIANVQAMTAIRIQDVSSPTSIVMMETPAPMIIAIILPDASMLQLIVATTMIALRMAAMYQPDALIRLLQTAPTSALA